MRYSSQDFEGISVRGRVAFSIHCLLKAIQDKGNLHKEEFYLLFEALKSYSSLELVDDWLYRTAEYIPGTLVATKDYSDEDFEFLDKHGFHELKKLYSKLDREVLLIIDTIFEMGTIELYGALSPPGRESLRCIDVLFGLLKKMEVEPVSIEPFRRFTYFSHDGYGGKFEMVLDY